MLIRNHIYLTELAIYMFFSIMNRLQSELVEQLPQTILKQQPPVLTNNNQDDNDDAFLADTTANDHQANIRRRAPTRHSIKSLTGRKKLSKQNSTNEVI